MDMEFHIPEDPEDIDYIKKVKRNYYFVAVFHTAILTMFILQAARCKKGLIELLQQRQGLAVYIGVDIILYLI